MNRMSVYFFCIIIIAFKQLFLVNFWSKLISSLKRHFPDWKMYFNPLTAGADFRIFASSVNSLLWWFVAFLWFQISIKTYIFSWKLTYQKILGVTFHAKYSKRVVTMATEKNRQTFFRSLSFNIIYFSDPWRYQKLHFGTLTTFLDVPVQVIATLTNRCTLTENDISKDLTFYKINLKVCNCVMSNVAFEVL